MEEIHEGGVWQAAFAITRGARLLGVTRAKDHGTWRLFRLSNEAGIAEQALEQWADGDTTCDAKELSLAYSQVVQLLRNERGSW